MPPKKKKIVTDWGQRSRYIENEGAKEFKLGVCGSHL
jgi:hypothetical protein